MSIISQPLGVLPAHVALNYEVFISIPTVSGETLKQVIITVTRISTGDISKFRQNFDTVTTGGGFTDGFATINLYAIGKSFFSYPFQLGAFGVLGVPYNNLNPLSIEDMGVFFTYDKVNTDGILEDIGVVDTAIDITLLNAVRDICDPQDINAYILPSSGRLFFTNRPEIYPICYDDNDFLQYWTNDINSFRVRIYPTENGLPRSTYVFADNPLITNNNIASVGAGVVNLNAISSFLFIDGSTNIESTDFKYIFEAGIWNPIFETFTPVTEEQCFKIVECCDRLKCTLFFLNRLGGVDRYSFDGAKQIKDNSKSSFYEKPRVSAFNIKSDFGRQKYDSTDKNILILESKNICEEVSEWLRELQTSTRVYKQVDTNNTISVVIRDSDTIIKDDREPIIKKIITIEYSVDPCIQNNI